MADLASIDRAVRMYNRNYRADRTPDGVVRIFQRVKQWRDYWLDDGSRIRELYETDWHAFSVTHNWSSSGEPVDWGIDHILTQLKRGMIENRDALEREIEEQRRLDQESQDRTKKSEAEACASDLRDEFKVMFKDTLTHSMDMSKDVRRKHDKRSI